MIYLVLLLAFLIRLPVINQSFWLDEGATLMTAKLSLSQLFTHIVNDLHPPLYYLLIHFWLKLGIYSEWFLRLPNIIAALVTVYFLYLFVKILTKSSKSALIASFLLAINPLHIYYSQELRMYALSAMLAVIAWFFLLQYLLKKDHKKLLAFILLTTLSLYTFYGLIFNFFAQFLFVYFYHRKNIKYFLLSTLTVFLLFLPWLPTLSKQFTNTPISSLLPGWSVLSGTASIKSLLLIPLKFTTGRINLKQNLPLTLISAVSLFSFVSLAIISFKKIHTRQLLAILTFTIFPAFLISFWLPMLGYWRYIFLIPIFVSLVAVGITSLRPSLSQITFMVTTVLCMYFNYVFWTTPGFQREDWRSATSFAASFNDKSTVSLFAFSDAFAPVLWYTPQLHYLAPLNKFSSSTALHVNQVLDSGLNGVKRVLLFEYISSLSDPQNLLKTKLEELGFQLQKTHNFTGVGFVYEYTLPS